MPQIKYHYAFDEAGNLVSIDEVTEEYRRAHTFYCIGCGKPMEARLGSERARHFAHKAETEGCGTETYLHQLGKYLIKEKFDSGHPFEIGYYKDLKCPLMGSCSFYSEEECQKRELFTLDLREYYDKCSVEQNVGSYKADLLLSSSKNPKLPPLLIEIQVTHENSTEKNDSGLRIIELRFRKEEEIRSIARGMIKEHPANELKNSHIPDVKTIGYGKFYGFRRDDVAKEPLSVKLLGCFSLFANGAAHVDYYQSCHACCQQKERRYNHSILELKIDTKNTSFISPYEWGYVTALNKGIQFRSCAICKYRVGVTIDQAMDGLGVHFCTLYKTKNTPKSPKSDYANQCEFYRVDKALVDRVLFFMKKLKIVEV